MIYHKVDDESSRKDGSLNVTLNLQIIYVVGRSGTGHGTMLRPILSHMFQSTSSVLGIHSALLVRF